MELLIQTIPLLLVLGVAVGLFLHLRRKKPAADAATIAPGLEDWRGAAATSGSKPPRRDVGPGLAIGILVLPVIFVWMLLPAGYSTRARLLGFGWTVIWLAVFLKPYVA